MWYAGWQTQQTLDSGQLDTIYLRTSPTSDGPWSAPATAIVAAQVAPQVTEVNDPSVTIVTANGAPTIHHVLHHPGLPPGYRRVCDHRPAGANSEVWSGHLPDGVRWGSFKRMTVAIRGRVSPDRRR